LKIPDGSEWIKLYAKAQEEGHEDETVDAGSVALSIEIWPKSKADAQPVGAGRSEPNQNPYCPKPTGRMKLSLNPFEVMFELLGPGLCIKLSCVLCCLFIIALALYMGPTIVSNYISYATYEN